MTRHDESHGPRAAGTAWVSALLALALAAFAPPGDAQNRSRPTEEELRKQDQQILEELKKEEEKYQRERQERLAGQGKKHSNLPSQDPCGLLNTAEVVAAIANAQPGKRDHFNEAQGVSRCVWSSANGAPLLKLELRSARGDAKREAPQPRPPAYRDLSGIGDDAAVWIVPRTPPALHNDIAFGGARKGGVAMRLESIELAKLGGETATRAVEKLLKTAVGRL